MFRRIVEYISPVREAKGQSPRNPTGMKTYLFQPQEEVCGIAALGRWVCVVNDEKAFKWFEERPKLFAVAADLEARIAAKEFIAAMTDPAVREDFAVALEGLGFLRSTPDAPDGPEAETPRRRPGRPRKAVVA